MDVDERISDGGVSADVRVVEGHARDTGDVESCYRGFKAIFGRPVHELVTFPEEGTAVAAPLII